MALIPISLIEDFSVFFSIFPSLEEEFNVVVSEKKTSDSSHPNF